MEFVAVIYMLVYAASGVALANLVVPVDRPAKRAALGLAFGLALLMWLPALVSFVTGFTLAAQYISLGLDAALLVISVLLYRRRGGLATRCAWRGELRVAATCLPVVLVLWALMLNHVITPASDGSLHSGQSTYGDMCMHLGFISSISVQETFPPEYSIMPGVSVGYPFLGDSVSSTFYTLGTSLRFAALLPMMYAALVVVLGVYFMFETWLGKNKSATIATYLFFIGGGFGFAYIFDMWRENGASNWQQLMDGFYHTPTNMTDHGLLWVNPIADMLVPQRATLFGWAMLFPALTLLYRAAIGGETRLFFPLGVMAGLMPLVHTHSFLALGVISLFLLCAEYVRQLKRPGPDWRRRIFSFVAYGLIAVAISAPQLICFTFRQASGEGFLRLQWNWANDTDSWLWFYVKNMGLIFILLVPAFISARRESRLFYGGALLLWAISEFVVFQPNAYDNNKLLFVWFALTCGIVSEYMCRAWDRLQANAALAQRASNAVLALIATAALFTSGTLTLAREYVSGDHIGVEDGALGVVESGYQVVSADHVRLAEYISENTAPDAVFLTASNHNNAVAMLTGRSIVCGSGSFLYYHGLDYSLRQEEVRLAFEDPEHHLRRVAEEYDVSYVLISSYELGGFDVDTDWFAENLEEVFSSGECVLYAVG